MGRAVISLYSRWLGVLSGISAFFRIINKAKQKGALMHFDLSRVPKLGLPLDGIDIDESPHRSSYDDIDEIAIDDLPTEDDLTRPISGSFPDKEIIVDDLPPEEDLTGPPSDPG